MTAEIAILNTVGVALAADSAVTLEVRSQNSTDKKIFNSTNKLFALSKFHPVGIMVFGNASLMGLPWEIIIKNYRSQLWKKGFDNLFEYADDFLKYLEHILPEEEQEKYFEGFVNSYFDLICKAIKKEVAEITANNKKIPLAGIKKTVTDKIDGRLGEMRERPLLPHMPKDFDVQVTRKQKKVIDEVIERVFVKLPISKVNRSALIEIAGLLFVKDIFPNNSTGVVVAGYGRKDNFPSLIALNVASVINNTVKYSVRQKAKIDYSSGAVIVPFAQNEMVYTFMEGINPEYKEMIKGTLSDLLENYPRILLDSIEQIQKHDKENMLNVMQSVREEIEKKWDEFQQSKYVSPVLDAVRALPKDELAIMAETLVNLTSFKRKMSLEAETVGGPIDVAVISKGDGFVWIKRKHYFSPDLNHHFFSNYYERAEERRNHGTNC